MFISTIYSLLLSLPDQNHIYNIQKQKDVVNFMSEKGITVKVLHSIVHVGNFIELNANRDISPLLIYFKGKILDNSNFKTQTNGNNKVTKEGLTIRLLNDGKYNDVHHSGLDGKDIKIGIVDSGIDEFNRELSGRVISCNDYTPEKNCKDNIGHGTRVAIVAAGATSGIAKRALLANYKVTTNGDSTLIWMLLALEQAFKDRMNIINISVGARDNEGGVLDQVIDKLTTLGVIVVASNGNSPSYEISYPARIDNAISVASTDNVETYKYFTINNSPVFVKTDNPILEFTQFSIYKPGMQSASEGSALMFLDLPMQTFLWILSTPTFHKVKVILFCDVKDLKKPIDIPDVYLNIVKASRKNCYKFLQAESLNFDFSPYYGQVTIPTRMSDFNSVDWFGTRLNPEISAPGPEIVFYSSDSESFIMKSGSSLAAPYISGSAALFLQIGGSSNEFKSKLMNTASVLENVHPMKQGAGFVNLGLLINTMHSVSPYKMTSQHQVFTINNDYLEPLIYDIELTYKKGILVAEKREVDTPLEYKIGNKLLRIDAQGKKSFTVTLKPNGIYYGGYINVIPRHVTKSTPILHIPFLVK